VELNNWLLAVIILFCLVQGTIKRALEKNRHNPKSTFWTFSVHLNTIICHHYPASGEHTYTIKVSNNFHYLGCLLI